MKKIILFTQVFLSFLVSTAFATTFNSGSTGADGAFNPSSNTVLQVPPSGVFNYTTVNIPSNVTVTFTQNVANTPVYMLATGDVTIAGTINLNGDSTSSSTGREVGSGGPGGFNGGYGGVVGMSDGAGGKGMGPGGGGAAPSKNYSYGGGGGFGTAGGSYGANYGAGGSSYGDARLIPLIGGSGGGGGAGDYGAVGPGGAGGGGAILIASSGIINLTGSITANGGSSYCSYTVLCGGSGSGGAIKLMANTITGTGNISANGGGSTITGGNGRIRIEGYSINYNKPTYPAYSYGFPGPVFVSNQPTLQITSIAGVNVPASPTGSYAAPDITLPSTTTNPVAIAISASNIPVGTTVTVLVAPQQGNATNVNGTLSGTDISSTASVSANLSTSYPSIVTAQATFTLQTAMLWEGERIDKVRVAATFGGESEAVYITETGKEVQAKELMAKLME